MPRFIFFTTLIYVRPEHKNTVAYGYNRRYKQMLPHSKNQRPLKKRRYKAAMQRQQQSRDQEVQAVGSISQQPIPQSTSQNKSTNSAAVLSLLDNVPTAMTSASISNIDGLESFYAMVNDIQGNPIPNQHQEAIVAIHAPGKDIPKSGKTPVQQPVVANI